MRIVCAAADETSAATPSGPRAGRGISLVSSAGSEIVRLPSLAACGCSTKGRVCRLKRGTAAAAAGPTVGSAGDCPLQSSDTDRGRNPLGLLGGERAAAAEVPPPLLLLGASIPTHRADPPRFAERWPAAACFSRVRGTGALPPSSCLALQRSSACLAAARTVVFAHVFNDEKNQTQVT
jgi:hypothetical protein